jgi:hypothetical protein
MMEGEEMSETLLSNAIFLHLIAREDFSVFICHESLKSYKVVIFHISVDFLAYFPYVEKNRVGL